MDQAQHIWKMLDDMAASDPEAYQKFVKQNIENGVQEMKREREIKNDELSIEPQQCYSMKIWANLQSEALPETEIKLSLQQNEYKQETFRFNKVEKRIKFYINLLSHSRVLGAFDKNDQPTIDPKLYNLIPLSIGEVQEGKSTSFNNIVYFYDIVINDDVYSKINRQILQSIILDTFQARIQTDKNPLTFRFYKAYYKLEIPSLQIIKKSYKYSDGKKKQIKLLLEVQADKQPRKQQPQELPKVTESFTRPEIPDITLPIQQQTKKSLGKPLIEEIDNNKEIEIPYQMTHEQDKITILLNVNVNSFQEIDLSISNIGLKLTTISGQSIKLDFGHVVDSDHPQAKWDKKKKQLKIVVHKI